MVSQVRADWVIKKRKKPEYSVVGCNFLILSQINIPLQHSSNDSCSIFDIWRVCGHFVYCPECYQLYLVSLFLASWLKCLSFFLFSYFFLEKKWAWRPGVSSQLLKAANRKPLVVFFHRVRSRNSVVSLIFLAKHKTRKMFCHTSFPAFVAPKPSLAGAALWLVLVLSNEFADPPSLMYYTRDSLIWPSSLPASALFLSCITSDAL